MMWLAQVQTVLGRPLQRWVLALLPALMTLGSLLGLQSLGAFDARQPSGEDLIDIARYVTGLALALLGVQIGAGLGAYDHQQGLIRPWLIAGASRSRIFWAGAGASLVLSLMSCLAAALGCWLVLSNWATTTPLQFDLYNRLSLELTLRTLAYTLMAYGVARLARAPSPAFTIVLSLSLVVFNLGNALALISPTLEDMNLVTAVATLAGDGPWSLTHALLVYFAWPAVFLAGGLARLQRGEY